jgi:hypothetical protein
MAVSGDLCGQEVKLREKAIDESLEYSRHLYENIVDWYKAAELKAQVVLSLAGIFTSFLIASIFVKRSDAKEIVGAFAWHTWVTLGLMTFTLVGAIISAVMCLVTRVMPRKEVQRRYGQTLTNCPPDDYPPEMLWFFQALSVLDENYYGEQALKVSAEVEKKALINENFLLAAKVLKKHIWVNWGFGCVAATLVFFLLTGLSYIVQIS